jgi:hypothetical protein
MSAMTVFYQECPVCGRNLRIAVKYYGRPMSCAHCEGEFIAGKDQARPPCLENQCPEKSEVIPSIGGLLTPPPFAEPQFGEV